MEIDIEAWRSINSEKNYQRTSSTEADNNYKTPKKPQGKNYNGDTRNDQKYTRNKQQSQQFSPKKMNTASRGYEPQEVSEINLQDFMKTLTSMGESMKKLCQNGRPCGQQKPQYRQY